MKNEARLRAEYSDVLDGSDDPTLTMLVARLDGQLGFRVGQAPDQLVGSIRRMARDEAAAQTAPKRWRSWRLPTWSLRKFGSVAPVVVACVLIVALLTGASYAAYPAFQRLFDLNSDVGVIFPQGPGEKVNISRSKAGFTMTVRYVSADANQIVIGYTLSGPKGRHFNTIQAWGKYDETPGHQITESPILMDANGKELDGGVAPVGNVSAPSGEFANMLIYSMPKLPAGASAIQVHLTVQTMTAYQPLAGKTFRANVVNGPFLFDLNIPIHQDNGSVQSPKSPNHIPVGALATPELRTHP